MIPATCRNCDAPLSGPYCAQCGQHAHESARTITALSHDAWHVITHVDGRFWSTLRLLLLRPGQLTLEYFAERRARYVPPVRLYLVLSIAFFGLTSLSSSLHPGAAATGHDAQQLAAERAEIERDVREAVRDAEVQAGPRAATTLADSERRLKAATEAAATQAGDGERGGGFNDFNFDVKSCDQTRVNLRRLEQPLRDACRRAASDHGKTLKRAFVQNVPKAMFVFLPLIAFVMRLLYWWPRRYYVEHLVFVLHNHAALFLAMILLVVAGLAERLLPALGPVVGVLDVGWFCYAVWYVYRSTRRYYGQGRTLTLAKLTLVGIAYLACLLLTLVGNFLVSALTA